MLGEPVRRLALGLLVGLLLCLEIPHKVAASHNTSQVGLASSLLSLSFLLLLNKLIKLNDLA